MARYIKIESCTECKSCYKNRDYTEDSFETCFRYDCRHKDIWDGNVDSYGKNIARYVDWYEKDPEIPDWCPHF